VIVWQSGASSMFLWRVREGIRRCQRGGLFVIVWQLGASYRAVRCQLVYLRNVRDRGASVRGLSPTGSRFEYRYCNL
jgi:hypothetical protein